MAGKRIKGITIEIDGNVTKLDKALSSVDSHLGETQKNLKDVNRLLKMDPGNTELLAQKQRLLADAVSATKDRLDTMREAAQNADAALARGTAYEAKYGPLLKQLDAVSSSYKALSEQKKDMDTALAIGEISTDEYAKFEKKLQETGAELKELRAQKKAADQEFSGAKINQSQYDALQRELLETEQQFRDAEKEAKSFSGTLGQLSQKTADFSNKAGKISDAFAPVSTAIAGLGAAAVATIPATEEFRADMSMLEQNAKNAGISLSPVEKAFQTLMIVTEDTTGSVSALQSLMDAGATESNIQLSVESLAGAIEKFPSSFKIDSLADSLNKSLESGQATGQFANLLDQLGVDVKEFNSRLQSVPDGVEQLNLALGMLSRGGLGEFHETWKNMNRELVQSRQANLEYVDSVGILNSTLSKTSENAGLWIAPTEQAFNTFLAVSGEVDSSVEAISNLLQSGVTESTLQKAVENLAGAATTFPDTLKIESLADSLQETVRTGAATGQFAELIERLGLDLDSVNKSIAGTSDETQRFNALISILASQGMAQNHESWLQANEDLVNNRIAQKELQEAMAGLAMEILPLVTDVVHAISDLLEWFNALPDGVQAGIGGLLLFVGAISPVAGAVSNTSDLLGRLSEMFAGMGGNAGGATQAISGVAGAASGLGGSLTSLLKSAGSVFLGPVGISVGAAAAAIAVARLWDTNEGFRNSMMDFDQWITGVFTTDWSESFGAAGEVLNGFSVNAQNTYEAGKQFLGGIIDFINGIFSRNWEQAWTGIIDIFGGAWGLLESIAKAPLNSVIGTVNSFLQFVTDGINSLSQLLNGFSVDVPNWVPGIGGKSLGFDLPTLTAPQIPYLANGALAKKNNPFFAVVGDNKREDEIIAPVSTIIDAVKAANAQSGGGRQQPLLIGLTISGELAPLFRYLKVGIDAETTRQGVNLVTT